MPPSEKVGKKALMFRAKSVPAGKKAEKLAEV